METERVCRKESQQSYLMPAREDDTQDEVRIEE